MILNEFFDSNKKHSPQQGVAESADDDIWGPRGNFAGHKHVDIGGVTMKIIQVGDTVKYLGQQAKVVGMSKDRKYSRISIGSGFGGSVKDVLTADLKQLGQGVAEARSPEEFVRQMDKIAATPQTFEVGDWVTIDPNETSGYASSGMIGRIIELYDDEGESMAKIAVGGGSGVQKKLGKGVRSSGTHTVVPTSILQKDDPRGVAEGATDTVYPNAEIIKSKNGRTVGEIYQDENGWGFFHYGMDGGNDFIDSREDAIQGLKDFHAENRGRRPDYTIKGMAEVSRDTLKSYQQKVSADSMKHSADPTKRSQQKANRSVAGFAKAQNRLEQGVAEGQAAGSVQDSFVQRLGRKLETLGYTQTGPGTWSQSPDGRYVAITPLPDGRYGWELRRVNRRGKWYSGVDTEEEVVRLFFKEFNKDIFSKDPVDEGLAEVSDATKQSYKAKAQAQVQQLEPHAKKGEYRDIAQRAIDRRQRGLTRFQDKTNVKSVSETGMKAKSIEFQDYKTMTPLAFHSRYGMTRDDWMTQNRNLFAKFNPAHRARDTALAKMRQAAAARADVKAAQTLAPRVSEGLAMPEGLPALGQANITKLIQTYKRNEPFAELSFGNSGNLKINRKQMRLIMDHYLKLPTPEKKHDFVYKTMSHMLLLIEMFDSYRRDGYDVDVDQRQIAVPPGQKSPVPGAQPQLFELDAGEVKDTRLSRALKQARAEFPTAGSDIEAFLKLVMSNDDRDLAAMNRMQAVNKKQSELLDRIQNIDQKQNQEIGNLESELDRVTQVNQNLERELNRIQSAKPGAANREPRKDTAEKPAAEKPAARVDVPVGQDISTKAAKKTKAQVPSKVSYSGAPQYKTTLQPPKYSMPQLQAPAQAQLPAPTQQQRGLFPDTDITDVIPRAVVPSTNGIKSNPVLKSLDQEITGMFQPAANDPEDQRQANAESRDPQRAIAHIDFDSPEWHEKVRRVGQLAKQGPLKTVWDPVKRVYRNVPVDQPADKKPSSMTEARLHRRAVLRQILES